MNPSIRIVFYASSISSLITYCWWVHFRVWLLRQDLFRIRDALWDEMRRSGQLEHPSHTNLRDGINAVIRLAPYLSMRTIAKFLVTGVEPSRHITQLKLVKEANDEALMRILRYLFLETLTGLICTGAALAFLSPSLAKKQISEWVSRVFDSSDIRSIEIPGIARVASGG